MRNSESAIAAHAKNRRGGPEMLDLRPAAEPLRPRRFDRRDGLRARIDERVQRDREPDGQPEQRVDREARQQPRPGEHGEREDDPADPGERGPDELRRAAASDAHEQAQRGGSVAASNTAPITPRSASVCIMPFWTPHLRWATGTTAGPRSGTRVRLRQVRLERVLLRRLLPAHAEQRMREPDLHPDVAEQRAVRVCLDVFVLQLRRGCDARGTRGTDRSPARAT